MAYFRTCLNCATPRKECATAKRISDGIRGLGITSVKFNCSDRKPKFFPGQRVEVSWMVHDGGSYDEGCWDVHTWPATVSCESGNRFVIRVDDVDSDLDLPVREYVRSHNLYCKVSAGKLKAIDEPDYPICKRCGEIGGTGFAGCNDINLFNEFPLGANPNCMRAAYEGKTGRER